MYSDFLVVWECRVCCEMPLLSPCYCPHLLLAMSLNNLFLSFSSYLELLGTFRKLVGMKKSEFLTARNRTKVGLDKVSSLITPL